MAKTKKNNPKNELRKVKNGQIKKHQIQHCVVRLTKEDCNLYLNSNVVITKSFEIKIRENSAEVNNSTIHSSNKTFTFSLKNDGNDVVLEGAVQSLRKMPARTAKVAEAILRTKLPKTTPKIVAKSLNEMINDAWRKCKADFKSTGTHIEKGTIVMAKMSGYSAWPGHVEDFTKNGKRAHVRFFGSNNNGSVFVTEIVPFEGCHNVIRLLVLRKLGLFHRSIREIERILGIPDEHSLIRESFSIKN